MFFEIECAEHGAFQTLASEHPEDFERWTSYESVCVPPRVRRKGPLPAVMLQNTQTGRREPSSTVCPLNCGVCEQHLMTACCVLLDVTARCNQHCPWCFARAGEEVLPDPGLSEISAWYDRLLELGEERPFNIQLSGGEPTVRDDLAEIIRMGREKGFEYIQLNTN
ncbi:MAG: hypothetical protein LBN35_04060, partial [Clostridiales Family XIII bacterium]|nr:hypothetical protein [Clostridiales Family XIII bacterium]